ncbi:Hint domain-containing protein [Nioella sp.]|uniref:Hint domain-containing protein n=1 Tax=Nioella sp. TaxID=1912091 RepID=UPI003B5295D6
MTDFTYISSAAYDSSGNLLNVNGTGGTLQDLDNDDTFAVNDIMVGGVSTYEGTVVMGGFTMPVVFVTLFGANQYLVYNPGPAAVTYDTVLPSLTLQPYAFCFAADTPIRTETGEVAVAALTIGDRLVTADGGSARVKWIGRQTIFPLFQPGPASQLVRISAGALGADQSHTDLTVTADHGMLVEGVICQAGALLNGATIIPVPRSEFSAGITVYHIETDTHEIILANGAQAETFIDNASRRGFDNFAEFEALYGDVPEMTELPYPRAMSARQVPRWIRAGLNGQAVA